MGQTKLLHRWRLPLLALVLPAVWWLLGHGLAHGGAGSAPAPKIPATKPSSVKITFTRLDAMTIPGPVCGKPEVAADMPDALYLVCTPAHGPKYLIRLDRATGRAGRFQPEPGAGRVSVVMMGPDLRIMVVTGSKIFFHDAVRFQVVKVVPFPVPMQPDTLKRFSVGDRNFAALYSRAKEMCVFEWPSFKEVVRLAGASYPGMEQGNFYFGRAQPSGSIEVSRVSWQGWSTTARWTLPPSKAPLKSLVHGYAVFQFPGAILFGTDAALVHYDLRKHRADWTRSYGRPESVFDYWEPWGVLSISRDGTRVLDAETGRVYWHLPIERDDRGMEYDQFDRLFVMPDTRGTVWFLYDTTGQVAAKFRPMGNAWALAQGRLMYFFKGNQVTRYEWKAVR